MKSCTCNRNKTLIQVATVSLLIALHYYQMEAITHDLVLVEAILLFIGFLVLVCGKTREGITPKEEIINQTHNDCV